MKKVLFTYDYGRDKMKRIEDLGYEVLIRDENKVVYEKNFKDVEVLVCYNPFSTLDISLMEKLKWIQLSSIGIDQIPKDIVSARRIIVTNNKGGYSIPMGEWIVLKILEMIKNSREFYEKQKQKIWKVDTSILELFNKTVGFIGTGTIAQEAAKRLKGFEVKLIGVNTNGRKLEYFDECYSLNEIKDVVKKCDFVVVSVPLTKETFYLIDKELIENMKDGVYIVNIARGSVINTDALIEAVKKGKIKKAALDVFEEEPLTVESPLWDMENIIITPHNSWVSEMRNERRYNIIYENMKRYAEGRELLNTVDIIKGY
ncbi:MAG: D-isomer specific 2-hydroxyacid dehydrogenase [Caloramator sp.]|jgi:phosphoglycerate dehydrogenase-like enzyme|uniref:phosphoglycerate dehydrogenase n=1 Tax=Caloramator sp. TaxID=1871330 RepID=UPI001E06BEFA|nr:phosphoglycerate dehydrogenase [Caloramator sp.]MBZ4662904.1 D-isomer specific 2-hydroxyacid dehydrogenase [Caloramator sp.]